MRCASSITTSGQVRFGYTTTEHGRFAMAVRGDELGLFTSEEQAEVPDDDVWLTLDEMRASVRRVMGGLDLELTAASRLSRFTFSARQAERFRDGRVLLAGDYLGTLYTETAIQTGFSAAQEAASLLASEHQQHAAPSLPLAAG